MLSRTRPTTILALLAAIYLPACGHDLPAQHPAGELSNRASARLQLIPLVIKDDKRAHEVEKLHLKLIALAPQFNRVRGEKIAELAELLESSPESLESKVMTVRKAEVETFAHYRALMIELRSLVSPEEYRRLMAIR